MKKSMHTIRKVRLLILAILAGMVITCGTAFADTGQWVMIPDGTYNIMPVGDLSYALDIKGVSMKNGAEVQIWNKNNTENQQFVVTNLGDGWVKIRAKHSGKYLDMSGGSKDNGTKVVQWSYHGGDNQRWRFFDAGRVWSGTNLAAGVIIAPKSGLITKPQQVLDNEGDNIVSGNPVVGWESNWSRAQKWILLPASKYTPLSRAYYASQEHTFTYKAKSKSRKLRIKVVGELNANSEMGRASAVSYKVYNAVNMKCLRSKVINKHTPESKHYVNSSIITIPKGYTYKITVKPYTTYGGVYFMEELK